MDEHGWTRKPRTVWLYWEGELPDWIAWCHRTIRAHAQDVRVLDPAGFESLRTSDRDIDLSRLCVAHRADFIRIYLLHKYGGLWIDSDCLAMRDLTPLMNRLADYEFIGFRERQGHVANNFMAARPGGRMMAEYYRRVCHILRSGQQLSWTTIGSDALTATLEELHILWLQLGYDLIQPICWSRPHEFFAVGSRAQHRCALNSRSLCYMLSKNTADGYGRLHPSRSLLDEGTFFRYLLECALAPVESAPHRRTSMQLAAWSHIPFFAVVIGRIAPERVLDVGVGFGRWGMLVREVCDEAAGRAFRDNWRVHVEGIAGSVSDVEEYHHHFYNWIHVGDPTVALGRMPGGWDLLFLNDAGCLERALEISAYVLYAGSPPDNLSTHEHLLWKWPAGGDPANEGAYVFSRLNPKGLPPEP
jgi:hypothetical protein